MGADDVALAWVRIHDESTRQRVVDGDLEVLGPLSLDDQEEAMVRRLADEGLWPEVEAYETSGFVSAFTYSYGKLSEPVVRQVKAQLDEDEVNGYDFRQIMTPFFHQAGPPQSGGRPPGVGTDVASAHEYVSPLSQGGSYSCGNCY